MNQQKVLKKFRLQSGFLLFFIIFTSCTFLIVLNFYTIRILSSTRAYINGESHYSKGQKDAAAHLVNYVFTSDPAQWKLFKKELSVPKGDALVRTELQNSKNIKVVKEGLLAGRNNEEDFDDMIWLFDNFKAVPFLAKAIKEWEIADHLVMEMDNLGTKIYQKMNGTKLDKKEQLLYLNEINSLSHKLTINELSFSNSLGDGTRKMKGYLIFANVFFILIIISSVSFYYFSMVKKLLISKLEVDEKNRDLTQTNHELDKFVYSVSHDLRSPITSLKGLVEIIKLEDDPEKITEYLDLMDKSLDRQDQFISDIIDYSRNKRIERTIHEINLSEIIDQSLDQFQYIKEASAIKIYKDLNVTQINNDGLRIKIILNNLLSNAIKYSDNSKTEKFIKIKTYLIDHQFAIEVEDNGIGIKEKSLDKIFDMFYAANHDLGSGLGLYIVKETVAILGGTLSVNSEFNVGTKFIVTLPQNLSC